MKAKYTATQLRRRVVLWESARNVSLIVFGGMWAMFLVSKDALAMTAWGLLSLVALAVAAVSGSRRERWEKRKQAGW